MAKELACPAPDDKVGLKIDYLAKCLAQSLAAQGFKRKGRNLLREAGDGVDRHWQIINFQSGSWNSGASGEFYVNVALQFPAIQRVEATRPGEEWLADLLDKLGEEFGQLRERLQNFAPDGHLLAGFEIKIGASEDLPALARTLSVAVDQWAVPWMLKHASVVSVRDHDDAMASPGVQERIAAALVLEGVAGVERLLVAKQAAWADLYPSDVQSLCEWLEPLGVNCKLLPVGTPPKKDNWTLRQEAEAAAEDARHAAEAAELMAQLDADRPEPALLAAAWLAEWRARWREEPKPLVDLPSGVRVAALDGAGREAVLLGLLQTLVPLEAQARHDPLQESALDFEPDEAVNELLRALLPTLASLQQAAALLAVLGALQTRLHQDMVTAAYPWGFAKLAAWIVKQPQNPALRDGIQTWMQGLSPLMLARWDATDRALAERYARPLDPNDTFYEMLLEQRTSYAAQVEAGTYAATRARIATYPEQSLAADDKAAVRAWRRWLRRDPVTGRLPVDWEADDWGGPALGAWQQAEPLLREALVPALQAWLEDGVTTKPKALTALTTQVESLPAEHRAGWQAWVLDRLRAFEHHSGKTEWATTRMRRGVGAVLGEDSESLLLGLLLWSRTDRGIADEALAPVWRSLTEAAWHRIPEHGARAPGVGKLGLRLLAGLGGASREFVQACAADKVEKQRAKAAAQALDDPLLRV